eukprot:5947707-Pyramimonas_sp.AAC.1
MTPVGPAADPAIAAKLYNDMKAEAESMLCQTPVSPPVASIRSLCEVSSLSEVSWICRDSRVIGWY